MVRERVIKETERIDVIKKELEKEIELKNFTKIEEKGKELIWQLFFICFIFILMYFEKKEREKINNSLTST